MSVSLNGRLSSHSEFADMVRVLGVHVSGPGPWRYNCDGSNDQPASSSVAGNTSPLPVASLPTVTSVETDQEPKLTTLQIMAEGGRSRVDKLIKAGFEPAGCLDGKLRMIGSGGHRAIITQSEVEKSQVAYLLYCDRRPLMQVSELESGPSLPTYWNSDCREDLDCYFPEAPGTKIARAWRASKVHASSLEKGN